MAKGKAGQVQAEATALGCGSGFRVLQKPSLLSLKISLKPVRALAERALARFNQPRIYKVSYEHSVMLVYRGYVYDEVLMALRVLAVSDIKAEMVFQV